MNVDELKVKQYLKSHLITPRKNTKLDSEHTVVISLVTNI